MNDLKLNFLGLSVADYEESFRFYSEVIGMEAHTVPQWKHWAGYGETWDMPTKSQGRAMICEMFGGAPPPPKDMRWGHGQNVRPGIQVNNLTKIVEDLRKRGVRFTSDIERTPMGERIELAAPEGVRWTLAQAPGYPTSDDMRKPRIGWVEIRVTELEAQKNFYNQILGLDVDTESASRVVLKQGPGEALVILEPGGETTSFDPSWKDEPLMTQPVWVSAMTAGIGKTASRLKKSGITVYRDLTKHPDWGGTDITIGDADGNMIQIVQYKTA